ncbi:MAG: hypothetical protein HRU13_10860, partial [Phycisphaerales bacterium]|nr:hypothetical protein [Phycisphaerales bacterium]
DANGNIAPVIEILTQKDEGLLNFLTWIEASHDTGHQTIQRNSLPSPGYAKLNSTSPITKGDTRPIMDTCAIIRDFAEIDELLAMQNGNSAAWRAQQERGHLIGMRQKWTNSFWYADDRLVSEQYGGMSMRYNDSVKSDDNPQHQHVLKADGVNDAQATNCSIWLITSGANQVHGIYRKGTQAGLQVQDLGVETKEVERDGKTELGRVYRTQYLWEVGLTVADWRAAGRIQTNLAAINPDPSSGGDDLIDLMIDLDEVVDKTDGQTAWFVPRRVRTMLRKQIRAGVANSTLTMETIAGKPVMMHDGIPVYQSDSLSYTEEAVN